jgi:hypothetical protein
VLTKPVNFPPLYSTDIGRIYYESHQYCNKFKSQLTSPKPAQLPAVAVLKGHIVYQRIIISYILSNNREKGYSPITFLSGICWGIWYPNFRDLQSPILSYILFRKKLQFLGTFAFVYMPNGAWPSSSGLRGRRRTYYTILKLADHALSKMVRYVLLHCDLWGRS